MNILYITHLLNGLLMIGMPIGLAFYLTRRFKQDWRLFWIGAGTFIISQVIHIPVNALVSPVFNQFAFIAMPVMVQTLISALFLGLSAGLFEELSRYAMYRWIAKGARSWGKGLLVGAGHGGAEAIILGMLALYAYVQFTSLRYANLATILPSGQLDAARTQISAYWSEPLYLSLLGALERLFAIPVQLACSLLVLQTFTQKQFWWTGLAILFHTLVDAVSVIAVKANIPALGIEGIVGIFALVSIAIIFALRSREPLEVEIPYQPIPMPEFSPKPVEETNENLDKTRYQ
jgi:uncharacterized membrane protein YhfC